MRVWVSLFGIAGGRSESGAGFLGFLVDEVRMEEALQDLWLTM